MKIRTAAALFVVLIVAANFGYTSTHPAGHWEIKSAKLTPQPEQRGHFVATVSKVGQGPEVKVEGDVPISELQDSFVVGDKLVALGRGGNADAVIIFDLLQRGKSDWFYCYQPQRVWDNLIAYVEWYPNHTPERVTDVVLLYDITKSPAENRQGKLGERAIAPTNPTRVGFPIYPESNASQNSYLNTVENQASVRLILGAPNFLALNNNKLVIAVGEEPGGDAATLRNYLVVVDLSGGISQAAIRRLPIPTDTFKKGIGSAYVQITSMEVVSANTVRLHVPEIEYGVDSVLVNIPAL